MSFFQTRFQTWALRNYVVITEIRTPTKIFLKIHLEFACFLFFLIHSKLKRQIRSYLIPVVSSKTISDSRPKWAKYICVILLKGARWSSLEHGHRACSSQCRRKKARGLGILLGVSREPRARPIRGWVASLFCVKTRGVGRGNFVTFD